MSALEALVLGVLQGLTEFLPISSSGHLRVAPALLGWDDPGAGFSAVVQLGTMAAVLLYFRRDLAAIALAWWRELRVPFREAGNEARLGWLILLGTIPISVIGFALSAQIESGARSLYLVGVALIGFSAVMFAAERIGSRRRELREITARDGVVIGLAQALALIPGVSRSGATISARSALRLRPRRGRPLLVPALGSRRRPQRSLRAAQHRRCGPRIGRGHGAGGAGGARDRIRGDRLAASLSGQPHA